jgi:hypothetical protein
MHKPLLIFSSTPLLQKGRLSLNSSGGLFKVYYWFCYLHSSDDLDYRFMGCDTVNLVELATFRCNLLLQFEKSEQSMDVVVPTSRVGRLNEEDGPNSVVP